MTEIIDKTLNMPEISQRARVIRIKSKENSCKQSLDMGMVLGAILSATKKALLRDSVDIKLKENLSFRKRGAEIIVVEQLEGFNLTPQMPLTNQGSLYLSYQHGRNL
ncbi:ferrous iron transport protein A [Methanosarcina barkeri 3]|uniref:Ferrous iron transport protein A n=1 Tax=Methanosarcina barkeri 3 TaxID=1434107 RepID=A0A0E3SMA4_METBA|nr:FeoA domain-containing protein [Methanosarcina barkeri]AKB82557.1 ferrous iron transport protein A [Methanosarcina barkeri 3]